MKSQHEVIAEFNELVNMTAQELEKWLKSSDSKDSGWPRDDKDGQTIGHDSGLKIVEILKANAKNDEQKYTDDQIQHMRKVVSYCKRHLAQEAKSNADKSPDELKETKSYASLKNWGHDPLKARNETDNQEKDQSENGERHAGDKRKLSEGRLGSNKKRETRQGESRGKEDTNTDKNGTTRDRQKNRNKKVKSRSNENRETDRGEEKDGTADNGHTLQDSTPKKGDTVSWNWGNGQPEGEVLEVKDKKATIKTKNGNQVSRDGTTEDPAVIIDAGKSKAVKLKHELNEVK